VWLQGADMQMTPKGRALALQRRVAVEDLIDSAAACALCGSCMPACPERIDLVGMMLAIRAAASADAQREHPSTELAVPAAHATAHGKTVLLGERRLLADSRLLDLVVARLGGHANVVVAVDAGGDVAAALEAGQPVAAERIRRFVKPLKGARRIVTCDGFLLRFLRDWLPCAGIGGLGEAAISVPAVRRGIRPTDLYVIEARAYHANWDRLVRLYTRLRSETGCAMNLDLQRFAIATTAPRADAGHDRRAVRVDEQIRWIVEGHRIDRIIVENLDDGEALRRETNIPVTHVAAVGP
jgi:ferredoxin